ncbi:putative ABC transport system substrate-binding protein [Bradyrhizobium shewense]|uniref:Putative ABC transport system substrate-binding protein n=2 Tax=Bradyrhizobium shewense TaxID=1761772 RepID=A0A1C3XTK0_9BRAD|nr:putative ABC transport system substrate-binding protein [Bradyrhizobium shewense]
MRHLGIMMQLPESSAEGQLRIKAFLGAFGRLGWNEGRNVRIDYRWTAGNRELLDSYARELVDADPDALLAGNGEVARALQRVTRVIPIVFAETIDPVVDGLVAELAHPGGNITGFMMFETSLAGKWLELLRALKPDVKVVAVMYDPTVPASRTLLPTVAQAASAAGLQVSISAVSDETDIKQFFESAHYIPGTGAIQLPGSIMGRYRNLIVKLAAEHRLPMIYGLRDNTVRGGLASYGVDSVRLYEQAASYVDRVLKGEKPADLPVQAATRYELVINLKAAKQLEIEPSPALLARADEVIE